MKFFKGKMYEGTVNELTEFLKEEQGDDIEIRTVFVEEEPITNAEKITTNKEVFVNRMLSAALRAANPDVKNCTYKKIDCTEIVEIKMKNGCNYSIDVTADSNMTIMADVAKYMSYR